MPHWSTHSPSPTFSLSALCSVLQSLFIELAAAINIVLQLSVIYNRLALSWNRPIAVFKSLSEFCLACLPASIRGQWLNCYCILHLLLFIPFLLFLFFLYFPFHTLWLLVLASTFGVNWQLLLLSFPLTLFLLSDWDAKSIQKEKKKRK